MSTSAFFGSATGLLTCLVLATVPACGAEGTGCQQAGTCRQEQQAPEAGPGEGSGGAPAPEGATGGAPTPYGAGGAPAGSAGASPGEEGPGGAGGAGLLDPDAGSEPGSASGGASFASDGGPGDTAASGADDAGDAGAAPDAEGGSAESDSGEPEPEPDPRCGEGFLDCNGDSRDGCETDPRTDPLHCGACQRACSDENTEVLACVAGTCRPRCATGFGSCSRPPAPHQDDGCETDLGRPETCGACNHDCLGGACTAGACEPYVVVESGPAARYPTVGGDAVYWAEGTTQSPGSTGRLATAPLRGGPSRQLLGGLFSNVDVDGEHLYTVAYDITGARASVMRIDRRSGLLTGVLKEGPLLDERGRAAFVPSQVVAVGGAVIWYDDASDRIDVLAKEDIGTGVSPRALVFDVSEVPLSWATDERSAFLATRSQLYNVSTTGFSLLGAAARGTLGVDETHVYYAGARGIARQHKAGSREELLASLPDGQADVAVGPRGVFYVFGGALYRVARTGGRPVLVAYIEDYGGYLNYEQGVLLWLTAGDTPAVNALVP